MPAQPLHVLVTRPEGQQHALVVAVQLAGFQVSQQSAVCVAPLELAPPARPLLLDIDQYLAVFFVSAIAARFALDILTSFWPQWPVRVNWFAVGPATAELVAA